MWGPWNLGGCEHERFGPGFSSRRTFMGIGPRPRRSLGARSSIGAKPASELTDEYEMTTLREMRILRLTPHFHRDGFWPVAFDPVGGLQIQTFILTGGIDRSGYAQTVATSHIPGSPRRQLLFQRTELLSVGPRLPGLLAGPLLC